MISIALSLAFLSNACDYTPSDADYHVDIDKPEPKVIKFWSELSPDIDTFYCQPPSWERNYVSKINIPDAENKVIFIRVKKDGHIIDSSYTSEFKFPVRNQQMQLLDPYELTLDIHAKTGSGSLADNVDKEAYVMQHSWIIVPFVPDSLRNNLSFEEENGKLKVNVDCNRGAYIREVSVMRESNNYDTGNYWTVFDSLTNKDYFIDDDYVGQIARYKIIYKFKSDLKDSIVMQAFHKEKEKINLAIEWRNEKQYLSWPKPKYYGNVVGYDIYTVESYNPYVKSKIKTIDNGNTLESAIELPDYYQVPFTLLLLPKTSNGSFKMYDDAYNSNFELIYSCLKNVNAYIPFYNFNEIMRYKDDYLVFSSGRSLKMYNFRTNELVSQTKDYSGTLHFSISPNRQILVWGEDNNLYFTQNTNFDNYEQMEIKVTTYPRDISSIKVSDNNYALLAKKGFTMVNLTSKKIEKTMYPDYFPNLLSFSKNAKHYLDIDYSVSYLKTYQNGKLDSLKFTNITAGCFSRHDDNILYLNESGRIYEYDIENKTEKLITNFNDGLLLNCIDNYLYAYGTKKFQIYDLNTFKLVDEGQSSIGNYIYEGETNKSTFTDKMLFFPGKKFFRRSK